MDVTLASPVSCDLRVALLPASAHAVEQRHRRAIAAALAYLRDRR